MKKGLGQFGMSHEVLLQKLETQKWMGSVSSGLEVPQPHGQDLLLQVR